jgi:hypothetical protein
VSRFKVNGFATATRGLAGLLAGALLFVEILGANGGFHQSLHANGKAAPSSCLLCLFAKAQVDLPQSAPVITAVIQSSFETAPLGESIVLVDFTYLAAPCRAPPAFVLLLPTVA